MDRTRRLSEEILQRHPEAFGSDFEENKKTLEELALIPSKQLRNRIAGYITKKIEAESEDSQASEDAEAPEGPAAKETKE
ncbi:MAG: 30S ribosomal protein S17e [Nitrososphaerota archaeon]|nr:30S ribosomal protein S17e [Nitrososphaerota archaeon]